jgi:ABC-2 type transport system permease protein
MTTPQNSTALRELRPAREAYRTAFLGLLGRDLYLLRKDFKVFLVRTLIQPLLLVFVFAYVFPKTGQSVGGSAGASRFSTQLIAGVIGLAIVFQGIQAVALPLVQEFGVSREIEDRVLAPMPTWMVGIQKILSGMLQGLLGAALVFPIAYFVPATKVHLAIHWPLLLTMAPLAGWVAGALGLVLGTKVKPFQVPLLFSVIVLPLTFLGCTYFPWQGLSKVAWLKWAVLFNPVVYMTEGFRASLVSRIAHMPIYAIYLALIGFAALFTWVGVKGFEKRVVS